MANPLIVLTQVSADWSNNGQSWYYASVWTWSSRREIDVRNGSFRIEIRKNAYEDQSYARISVWHGGWQFHTSIPTEDWFGDTPSYVRKRDEWTESHCEKWLEIEEELLDRTMRTLFVGATYELVPLVPLAAGVKVGG